MSIQVKIKNTSMKLIILDRDGVINNDSDDFIKTPDEWLPIKGSLEAIASLKAAGWTVAVATNQSGIARGLFKEETLQAMHAKMQTCLARMNASVDLIVWCPHGPRENCSCRKPKPGLYHKIAHTYDQSLLHVPIVGDSLRDLKAAAAVGGLPILVKTGKGEATLSSPALPIGTCIYPDLISYTTQLLAVTNDTTEAAA